MAKWSRAAPDYFLAAWKTKTKTKKGVSPFSHLCQEQLPVSIPEPITVTRSIMHTHGWHPTPTGGSAMVSTNPTWADGLKPMSLLPLLLSKWLINHCCVVFKIKYYGFSKGNWGAAPEEPLLDLACGCWTEGKVGTWSKVCIHSKLQWSCIFIVMIIKSGVFERGLGPSRVRSVSL